MILRFLSSSFVLGLVVLSGLAPRAAYSQSDHHPACRFLVADGKGNVAPGPSFDALEGGFTHGLLDCGNETHRMLVITLNLDTGLDHIGVRDDPLFSTDVTGALKSVGDVTISKTSRVHVLGRVNQSPHIGVHRGFVHFATLCDADDTLAPLDCSWHSSRIKSRTTTLDTDNDEVVDRAYHELSVYKPSGRLHMITFWTPYRNAISSTTRDWISALKAFGIDVEQAG